MKQILIQVFILFFITIRAQFVPPYYQHFDSINCTGWWHGAISGTDDWQRGVPTSTVLNNASSVPNVWATNLSGLTSTNSVMFLETPSFDLSDVSKVYVINFLHRHQTLTNQGGNIEISIDGGQTWQLLNGSSSQKYNWYNNSSCSSLGGLPAFSGYSSSYYNYSAHSLVAFQGQSNVKFRFKYGTSGASSHGWMIDDFSVVEDLPNVSASPGNTYNATKNFTAFTITSTLNYYSLIQSNFNNTTHYYFSYDSIFTVSDPLIGSKSQVINGSISAWTHTFAMVPNLSAGNYYIFYKHDAPNSLIEFSETDNISHAILHIDSTFQSPFHDNFEAVSHWSVSATYPFFTKGYSKVHQIEGTHSGTKSWYIRNINYQNEPFSEQFLESPYFDISQSNNNVICFWYRAKNTYSTNPSKLQIQVASNYAPPLYSSTLTIPFPRFNNWDCNCQSLINFNGNTNLKFRFRYNDNNTFSSFDQNVNLDDIYIGQPLPDLSIEHKSYRTSPTTLLVDTFYYTFFNSGGSACPPTTSEFYWSNDSILDPGDILLASINESTLPALGYVHEKFTYAKPTTAQGNYFILYKTDAGSLVNEMRESNNNGYYNLKQEPLYSLPYFNDFETQSNYWWHNASIGTDAWSLGMPSGTVISSTGGGTKAFHTANGTPLPKMSRMHLHTPVFDFTSITNPVIEFDMKMDSQGSCSCSEGKMNLSFSTDGGASWKILDTVNRSFNRWYYPMTYDTWGGMDYDYYLASYSHLLFKGSERAFTNWQHYCGRDATGSTSYILDVPYLAGQPHVQFRYNLASAKNDSVVGGNFEGAMIDNFKIRDRFIDLIVPYKKHLMMSSINQKIKFSMHIHNQGNFISHPMRNSFYVSVDSILDATDVLIGSDSIKAIRPAQKNYINVAFNSPSNLSSYKYLVYKIDSNNNNPESNESNNVGCWPLSLDSISTYPYLMDFNDSILNGWNEYSHDLMGQIVRNQWRSRHMLAFAEQASAFGVTSGMMFTDMVNDAQVSSVIPYTYVESPAFDFTGFSSLNLSFRLFEAAATAGFNSSGGNLQYSTNGGTTWSVLQPSLVSQAYNWYNNTNIQSINEPGWTYLSGPNYSLDSVNFDISFLTGQPHVVFRFKHRSKHAIWGVGFPQGMRVDNFRIDGIPTIITNIDKNTNEKINMYVSGQSVVVNVQNNFTINDYKLNVYNMLGQSIINTNIELSPGDNRFTLPENIADGVYLVSLSNKKIYLTQKVILIKP